MPGTKRCLAPFPIKVQNMRNKLFIFLIILMALSATAHAADTIKLKMAVVNPSDTLKQTTPVKYDLPKGIQPEHIVDKGDMEIGYDFKKGNYYVHQKITLEPAERKVIQIILRDIWVIPINELQFLRDHTVGLYERLEGTEHGEVGKDLQNQIESCLNEMEKTQIESSLNAREKMNTFYENKVSLDNCKENIGMLENLVLDVGGIVEDRVKVPETMTVSVPDWRGIGPWETLEMKITAANPFPDKEMRTSIRRILPKEVTPKTIIDADGLDVTYDFDSECFRVEDKELVLKPAETKNFTVKIKDIWRVPDVELGAQEAHTKNLTLLLTDTVFNDEAQSLSREIYFDLDHIRTSQNLKVPPPEHIAYFRDNLTKLDEIKKKVAKLEKMTTQSGSTPGVTIAKAERVEGAADEVKRPKGYEGVDIVAKTIFRGKAPEPATTWKIIFTIIGFVGLMSLIFVAIWRAQLKRTKK